MAWVPLEGRLWAPQRETTIVSPSLWRQHWTKPMKQDMTTTQEAYPTSTLSYTQQEPTSTEEGKGNRHRRTSSVPSQTATIATTATTERTLDSHVTTRRSSSTTGLNEDEKQRVEVTEFVMPRPTPTPSPIHPQLEHHLDYLSLRLEVEYGEREAGGHGLTAAETASISEFKQKKSREHFVDNEGGFQALSTPPELPLAGSTPTAGVFGAKLSQPPSPRGHLLALQEQQCNLPDSPSFKPLTEPIETFLDQNGWTDVADDPVHLEKQWRKLRNLQVEVFRRRAELRTKRQQLRRMEGIKIAADAEFMMFIRNRIADPNLPTHAVQTRSGNPKSTLEDFYIAMQTARNEYGPIEDEHARLIESLDDLEFQLAQAEGRVYKSKTSGNTNSEIPIHTHSVLSDNESTVSLTWTDQEENDPLLTKYLVLLGDLDLAHERFEDIEQEQSLLRNRQQNAAFDHALAAELQHLSSKHASLQIEIAKIQHEVEQSRIKCEEAGIVIDSPGDGSSSMCSQEAKGDLATSEDEYVVQETIRPQSDHNHSMFPILFPTSMKEVAALQDLITEFDEDNKSNRINRWLLYGLQTSPLGVDLFAQIFLDLMKIIDFSKLSTDLASWQSRVLALWYNDGTNMPAGDLLQRYSRTSIYNTSIFIPEEQKILTTFDFDRPKAHRKHNSAPACFSRPFSSKPVD